ncbi:MAG: hypothetical protein GWP91_15305 [Rhodobacterales bacterium]|nr:hypothetical protein [Rhodobacterales bacterium]
MASIRQQINIASPIRAVWRALTTAEGLKSWWADEARVDPREGGRVVVETEDDDGNPLEEIGMFLTFRPTRKVEIAWDTRSPAPSKGTRLSFLVAKDGPETRVSLIHSGHGILDDEEARTQLDRDWGRALKGLRDALEQ